MDEALADLQSRIMQDPKIGDVVRNSGGVRKVRISGGGQGRSGGYRVIYLDVPERGKVGLLVLISKRKQANLTAGEIQAVRGIVREIKSNPNW